MEKKDLSFVVEVLGERINIDDFKIDLIPDILYKWELGGITDPIGQLINWLWGMIRDALSSLGEGLEGFIRTVRDFIVDSIGKIIKGLSDVFSDFVGKATAFFKDIIDGIGSVSNFLSGLWDSITKAFASIGSVLSGIVSSLGDIWKTIQGLVGQFISALKSAWDGLQKWLGDIWNTIKGALDSFARTLSDIGGKIVQFFSGIASTLASIGSQIWTTISSIGKTIWDSLSSFGKGLVDFFSKIASTLGTFASQVWGFISSGVKTIADTLTGWVNTLWGWIQNAVGTIGGAIGQLITTVKTFFEGLWKGFLDLGGSIVGGFQNFIAQLLGFWSKVQDFFTEHYNKLLLSVGDLSITLQGFVNPLVNIWSGLQEWFKGLIEFNIWKKLSDLFDTLRKLLIPTGSQPTPEAQAFIRTYTGLHWDETVKTFKVPDPWEDLIKGFIDGLKGTIDTIAGVLSPIVDTIKTTIGTITDATIGFFKELTLKTVESWVNTGKAIIDGVKGFAKMIGESAMFIMQDILIEPIKGLSASFKEIAEKMKTGEVKGEFVTMAMMLEPIGKTFVTSYSLSLLIRGVADILDSITPSLKPFGLGVDIGLKPTALLRHISRVFFLLPDLFTRGLMYGWAIWVSQPIFKMLNAEYRNYLPVNIPTLDMMIEMIQRKMPSPDFPAWQSKMYEWLQLHGFPDTVIYAYLQSKAELSEDEYITVKDRFGVERVFPTLLTYNIPSGSEMARMMVHDIFGPPENPLPSFIQAMKLRGFHPDTAKMYYLLHFRYPTLENLWNFISRAEAGFTWVDAKPVKEEDLGTTGVSPKELSGKKREELIKFLLPYAKWHDYAGFSWIEGFTSDRLIMMDLMADIPMRIDARWMYKWGIKTDEDMRKIVIARGMHPAFVDDVTIAECMNALAEERTYTRTGVLNVFEHGFMKLDYAKQVLSNLTTIKILGKDVPVKFLDGEVQLLTLRSIYDRIDRLYSMALRIGERGVRENILDMNEALSLIGKVKENLKIPFDYDAEYIKPILTLEDAQKYIRAIERVRGYIRLFAYRLSQLAETGEDITPYLDSLIKNAKLTELEKSVLQDLIKLISKIYERRRKLSIAQKLAVSKLRSGTWTFEQALDVLLKAGMDKEEAIAYLEANAKTRTVSTDKLISMREYIPIDLETLKKKMDAEGVPEDEQKLYLPYAVAREIASEVGKVVTELGTDYVKNIITRDEFKTALDQIATLNGRAKEMLGVDWIIYSPQEREILLMLYDLRKARIKGR
jgi:phage-related protein